MGDDELFQAGSQMGVDLVDGHHALGFPGVVTGSGRRAVALSGPVPTPLVAFSVGRLGADDGVAVSVSDKRGAVIGAPGAPGRAIAALP